MSSTEHEPHSMAKGMSPEQVSLVQESFKKVQPIAQQAADLFYNRLFQIAPQVRPLFPADLEEQKRKLMAMLATAVTNLHRVDKIMPALQGLGRRHAGYGVTAEHYKLVGEALIWTLQQGLGKDFTPALQSAWVEAYTTLAGVMMAAAEADPLKVVVFESVNPDYFSPPRA